MATSIGTAWIQIKPSLTGITNDIQKQLSGAGIKTGKDFSKGFGSSFLSASKQYFSSAFSGFKSQAESAFNSFKSVATTAFVATFASGTVLLKNFISSASELQGLRASFESLTGSAEKATTVMNALADFGKQTAFSNEQINQSARLFLGAGIAAEDLLGIMQQVGDLAGATGADLEGIALPISQAIAAGKLQTQDWYQILNQGGGVLKQYIIDALGAGHSTKTFADDLSKGAVTADVLRKALKAASSEGGAAFQGAIKQSETFNGRMSNLQEAITNVGLSILGVDSQTGQVDPSGIFAKLSNAVSTATDWLIQNKDAINEWVGKIFEAIKSGAQWVNEHKELVGIVLKAIVGFKGLQIATGGIMGAMKTLSPYVNIVKGAITGVIGVAGKLVSKLSGAKKPLDDTAKGINNMSDAAKKSPKEFTFGKSLESFFKNIGSTLSGAISGIMAPLKTLANEIGNIFKQLMTSVGEGIAGFVSAFANPEILVGALGLAAAAASIAAAIVLVGEAITLVTPGLTEFWNNILLPIGNFLLNTVLQVINALTTSIISLTNLAVIPLGNFLVGSFNSILMTIGNTLVWVTQGAIIPLTNAVSGGLTNAINAISGLITSVGNAISGIISAITGGISDVINSIANLLSSVAGQDWYGTGYGITRNFSAGIIDGLIDFIQDGLNSIINNLLNVPIIGEGLDLIGVKKNPIDLSSFKLGKRAKGGYIDGKGGPTDDLNPYLLSNGEFVVKAASVRSIGTRTMDYINKTGKLPETGGSNGDVVINFGNGAIVVNGANDPEKTANAVWRKVSKKIADAKKEVMA